MSLPTDIEIKIALFCMHPQKKPLIMSFTVVIPPYSLLGLSKSCLVAYLFFGDEIFTYHCPWHDFLKLASLGYSNYLGSSPFINPLGTSFFWIIRCLMQNSFLLLKKKKILKKKKEFPSMFWPNKKQILLMYLRLVHFIFLIIF